MLPAKLNDERFEFIDGQKILFDYKELPDIMSICMAQKMAIEINVSKKLNKRKNNERNNLETS